MGIDGLGSVNPNLLPRNTTGTPAAGTTPDGVPAAADIPGVGAPAGDTSNVGGGNSSNMALDGDIEVYHAPDVHKDVSTPLPPTPVDVQQSHGIEDPPPSQPTQIDPPPPPVTPVDPPPPANPKPDPTEPPPVVHVTEPPPPPPPPMEKVIEVGGSGMGADKQFKMYPSELAAVYAILKDQKGGVMSLEDMQASLKKNYGIDTEIKDGTIVNKENGHTLIADTNGNGALDMGDIDFDSALKDAGIDPASIESPEDHLNMMSQVSSLAQYYADQVLEESRKTVNDAVGHTGEGAPVPEGKVAKPNGQGDAPAQDSASSDAGSGSSDAGSVASSSGSTGIDVAPAAQVV